jgi:hypothetical protein
MQVEFNPDGSVKLPGQLAAVKANAEMKMRVGRCVDVRKEVMRTHAPKMCLLHITLSDRMAGDKLIEKIHSYYMKEKSETPTKIRQINDKEWVIEIGSAFRRCSDCNSFVTRIKEFMDGNILESSGNCTFEKRVPGFSYEDFFG